MAATIIIPQEIRVKLCERHNVSEKEVSECFQNRCGVNLIDTREKHQTDPATLWFIAETNKGRLLKIVFMCRDGNIFLKSAFEPNDTEITIYEDKGK